VAYPGKTLTLCSINFYPIKKSGQILKNALCGINSAKIFDETYPTRQNANSEYSCDENNVESEEHTFYRFVEIHT